MGQPLNSTYLRILNGSPVTPETGNDANYNTQTKGGGGITQQLAANKDWAECLCMVALGTSALGREPAPWAFQ